MGLESEPPTASGLRLPFLPKGLLIGLLVLSGCESKPPGEQPQPAPEKKGEAPAPSRREQVGQASWYGPGFEGKETASGETFKQDEMTAASPHLPLGSKAEVTNLETGKKVEVEITDRGPYAKGRAIDLSRAAAEELGMTKKGTAPVKIKAKSHPKRGKKPGKHYKKSAQTGASGHRH